MKSMEQMISEARALGVDVKVSTRPKGQGEVTLLQGVRPPTAAA